MSAPRSREFANNTSTGGATTLTAERPRWTTRQYELPASGYRDSGRRGGGAEGRQVARRVARPHLVLVAGGGGDGSVDVGGLRPADRRQQRPVAPALVARHPHVLARRPPR